MGNDGIQYLEIRGSNTILDQIQESGLVLETDDTELYHIAYTFFGKERIIIKHRSEKYLVISYDYRNAPFHNYLRALLRTYPSCWMKNEYVSDDGSCGLWIAHFSNNEVIEQILNWNELSLEELCHEEDFSK